jgi:hypothetical protein
MKPMMRKKALKPLPAFNSEGEERDFLGHGWNGKTVSET